MPRQFGIGQLLILFAIFGVMFAVLKTINVHPIIYIDMSLFLCGIAIGQAVLFKGRRPRMASCIVGFILGLILGFGIFAIRMLFDKYFTGSYDPRNTDDFDFLFFALGFIILGGPFGYLVGCLIAGIFLRRERESDKANDDKDKSDDEMQ